MNKFLRKNLFLVSFIFIPIFFLWHPNWIGFLGNQPYWPLFWLLPYSMINGSMNGLVAAIFLGLLLDSLTTNGSLTQIPGLSLCGIWLGRFRKSNNFWVDHLRFGLICSIGTFLCGIIYFSQILFKNFIENNFTLFFPSIQNILAQLFLTGLLAPLICSRLYKLSKISKY